MKYIMNYGNRAAVFPEKVLEVVGRAGANDLRVFLCLCAMGGAAEPSRIAELSSCSEDAVRESLSFWRGTGLIAFADEDGAVKESGVMKGSGADSKAAVEPSVPASEKLGGARKLKSADELPRYTSEELANILEERTETATLIDECQNIMGKVFNVREINVLMGLVDYLGLDCEYIMMLLTYCVSIGKKTLHYAEKTAFALYDMGITTGAQLAEELRRREAASDAEGRIRSLFGVGERAFTTKEKRFISAWVNDMGYSIEIITKAYEVTADATGKGSFAYANSILERWNAAGLRTLDEIEESYRKNEGGDGLTASSFETDSFFEAAVRRSLGEN